MSKLEGGEFSEQMSACRVNTSNQRSHPHLLKDQGASDAPDAPKKEKKKIYPWQYKLLLFGFLFFLNIQDKIPHL